MAAIRIGIVATEPSGDLLAAGLMRAVRDRCPDARFEGVGGELMIAAGLDCWCPMERLSVMGLIEVLPHLPALISLRRSLYARWRESPPDIFVGVDAPDFNLGLETRLRRLGVKTVHYVCPTVWAWREGRVKSLRRAVDLILSVLPFEVPFLEGHRLPVTYVGHPLAREYPLEPPKLEARERLGLGAEAPVLAVLPGSRRAEIKALGATFLNAAEECAARLPGLEIVVPLVNAGSQELFDSVRRDCGSELPVSVSLGGARDALAAADVVLTASGTATLEGLLNKRPMVVGYRMHILTFWIVRALDLINVEHIAIANLLAGEALAPEFVQQDCRPELLADAVMAFFEDPRQVARIQQRYGEIHRTLSTDTDECAAEAVLELVAP